MDLDDARSLLRKPKRIGTIRPKMIAPIREESKVLELLAELKTELNEVKSGYKKEVACVKAEKQLFESKLSNLSESHKSRSRWRKFKASIRLANSESKIRNLQKLYGEPLYEQLNSEEQIYKRVSTLKFEQDKVKPKKDYFIYKDSKFYDYWGAVQWVMFIYTIIFTPLTLSLIDQSRTLWLMILEQLVNILFLSNILVIFRSSIVISDEEVDDNKLIFQKYLKSWLVFDVLSVIPYDLLNMTGGYIILAKIPKFLRLIRITKFISSGKARLKKGSLLFKIKDFFNLDAKVLGILKLAVMLISVVHLTGCLWLWMASIEEGSFNWTHKARLTDQPLLYQYMRAVYWAITTLATVGYGDILPTTSIEKFFCIVWMCFGAAFYSYMVSTLATVTVDPNSVSSRLQVRFDFLNSIAADAKISRELLEALVDNLEASLWAKEQAKIGQVEFLSDVPIFLRKAAIQNIHNGIANTVDLFKNRDPNILAKMIPKLSPLSVKKGGTIYKKEQFASSIFILFSGRVVMLNKNGTQLKVFVEGSYFGEYEVFLQVPRKYTVVALEDSLIMRVEKGDFLHLLQFYPELKKDVVMTTVIRQMQLKQTLHKTKHLSEIITIDSYWDSEGPTFMKELSEKITGLYYFHKKSYDEFVREKMQRGDWFRDAPMPPVLGGLDQPFNYREVQEKQTPPTLPKSSTMKISSQNPLEAGKSSNAHDDSGHDSIKRSSLFLDLKHHQEAGADKPRQDPTSGGAHLHEEGGANQPESNDSVEENKEQIDRIGQLVKLLQSKVAHNNAMLQTVEKNLLKINCIIRDEFKLGFQSNNTVSWESDSHSKNEHAQKVPVPVKPQLGQQLVDIQEALEEQSESRHVWFRSPPKSSRDEYSPRAIHQIGVPKYEDVNDSAVSLDEEDFKYSEKQVTRSTSSPVQPSQRPKIIPGQHQHIFKVNFLPKGGFLGRKAQQPTGSGAKGTVERTTQNCTPPNGSVSITPSQHQPGSSHPERRSSEHFGNSEVQNVAHRREGPLKTSGQLASGPGVMQRLNEEIPAPLSQLDHAETPSENSYYQGKVQRIRSLQYHYPLQMSKVLKPRAFDPNVEPATGPDGELQVKSKTRDLMVPEPSLPTSQEPSIRVHPAQFYRFIRENNDP